jgi:hypothetical protein
LRSASSKEKEIPYGFKTLCFTIYDFCFIRFFCSAFIWLTGVYRGEDAADGVAKDRTGKAKLSLSDGAK